MITKGSGLHQNTRHPHQLGFDRQAMPSCFWVKRSRAGEARHTVRPHPDAAVCDFYVFEDIRLRELVLLAITT